MISKTGRPIEVLALLLCGTTASAQDNRGIPSKGPRVRPTLSGFAAATSPIQAGSSTA
jgi:hypothetical protein